ncbi:DciA family protein [Acidisoma sp. C75]
MDEDELTTDGGDGREGREARGTGRSMAPRAPEGKARAQPDAAARSFAMRPIGGLIARVTRLSYRRRSPAGAQLMIDWPEIMGPTLAPLTLPQKLSAGTLTIGAQGPVAMELQHLAPQLIERLNAHLGAGRDRPLVQRLRFVPLAPGALRPAARPAKAAPLPPPPPLPGIAAGPLHEALARLGQAVEARRKPRQS